MLTMSQLRIKVPHIIAKFYSEECTLREWIEKWLPTRGSYNIMIELGDTSTMGEYFLHVRSTVIGGDLDCITVKSVTKCEMHYRAV